jgi:hypothetical protein
MPIAFLELGRQRANNPLPVERGGWCPSRPTPEDVIVRTKREQRQEE